MNEPGWYCEHCEKPVPGISDEADAGENQKCPCCHKRAVAWLTPDDLARRNQSMSAACPTAEMKADQRETAVTPDQVKQRKLVAAMWFQRMREATE